jgi:hypothetical protein
MTVSEMFSAFIDNLIVSNTDTISQRYGEVTAALNKQFRDTESKTDNSLQVGSFGRKTAIDGISDLDMLYIMPKSSWDDYKDENGVRRILGKVRDAILARYPRTEVKVDRCVVSVSYTNFHIEVQPVFEQDDKTYKYPDTYDEQWKIVKPRQEIYAIAQKDGQTNGNFRKLCKMARAWKNKHGVGVGGLLIDTLAYRFLAQLRKYDNVSFSAYGELSRDFFKFLSDEPKQQCYYAPGSNQKVKVKQPFQAKAQKAYKQCLEAIDAGEQKNGNEKWKKVFGRPFPANTGITKATNNQLNVSRFRDTEEFIDNFYPVDIRYSLKIDCDVSQNGFREYGLREMLSRHIPLLAKKALKFHITKIDVPKPYIIKWKVLNRGEEAERRDEIRGQILDDKGYDECIENTKFKGDHIVECYAIKDGVVVAKDRIRVPIANNG